MYIITAAKNKNINNHHNRYCRGMMITGGVGAWWVKDEGEGGGTGQSREGVGGLKEEEGGGQSWGVEE